jgi:hypothetical protein
VAAEEGLGDKGSISGHRKGTADPEKETPVRRFIRGDEEAALLRKALGEKKEEAGGSAEAKKKTPQARAAIGCRGTEVGKTFANTCCSEDTVLT